MRPAGHQVKPAPDAGFCHGRVHAAGKAVGGFRRQVLRPGGAPDVDHVPCGAFQQDVARILGYLRLQSAHHASQRKDAGFVTNQDGIFIQFSFDVIQGNQRLAFARGARNDLYRSSSGAFLQHVIIEGVQGFTQFQHGVIRGIHHVVDRPHTGEFEAVLHLQRGGLDLYIADQSQHKARVELRIGDLERGVTGGTDLGRRWKFRCVEGFTGDGSNLARQSEHAGAACKTGQQVHVQHGVPQQVDQRGAGRH